MRLPPLLCFAAALLFAIAPLRAQKVTSPKEHFGFAIGDDYRLANYTQTEAYFKKIAAESPRTKLVDIGRTEEGRTQWMMIVSAPENIARLDHYQSIARRLARAEGLTDAEARALAAEGKAVVWIDGGLHASETVATHQLIETIWQLASATDPETLRILRDTIILCAHANPDGQELVSNWYMREPDPSRRVLTPTPRLYQKYIGHDNNRDFYLSAMRETTNINRQLYLEWFPQIVYNHHQSAPAGTVIFVPPFRDPFNYNYDPLVVVGVQTLGTAIQSRFLEEGKPGATSRSGASYSTWFNGSLRTTSYFHNMIGLLSEIIGNPTPMAVPFIARRQLPANDIAAPVAPQEWRFRQSIEYSLSANRAVLDHASRHRDTLLYNIYRMGQNSIARGSRDSWTMRPSRLDEIVRLAGTNSDLIATGNDDAEDDPHAAQLPARYQQLLRKPEWRDPRGFILPADQPDFPTAIAFLNALVKTGIAVHRATTDFTVAGRRYPAGSYVVKTAQAFRPHVLDMFEPQDHPNDFRYAGGPPNRPYDVTGYTLAYQMGVKFDRVLEAFDGPFVQVPYGQLLRPPLGRIAGMDTLGSASDGANRRGGAEQPARAGAAPREDAGTRGGFLVSHRVNNSVILVNRLLKAGAEVFWLKDGVPGDAAYGAGAIYVPDQHSIRALVEKSAADLGLQLRAVAARPAGEALRLAPVRIALWDRYAGSMPSGWTRWILEQFEFPFEVVYSAQIDEGRLREEFDAIIFPGGAIPAPGQRLAAAARPRNLPREFEGWIGRITPERSVPALRAFLEAGGTVVTLGTSSNLGYLLGLPVKNGLVETDAAGREHPLSEEKFFVPGSVLATRVDATAPVAWGMEERADMYFERSNAFTLGGEAAARGLRVVAWYDTPTPLRSGWAWGQRHLEGRAAVVTAPVGAGTLHLMASEVAFRGQTQGTFKLLFNALHLATAKAETDGE